MGGGGGISRRWRWQLRVTVVEAQWAEHDAAALEKLYHGGHTLLLLLDIAINYATVWHTQNILGLHKYTLGVVNAGYITTIFSCTDQSHV